MAEPKEGYNSGISRVVSSGAIDSDGNYVAGEAAIERSVTGRGSAVLSRYFTPSLGHNWVKATFPTSTESIFVKGTTLTGAFLAVAVDLEDDAVADLIFTGGPLAEAVVTTASNDDTVASTDAGWIPVPCDGQVHEIPMPSSMRYGTVYFQHSASDGAGGGANSDDAVWMGAQS